MSSAPPGFYVQPPYPQPPCDDCRLLRQDRGLDSKVRAGAVLLTAKWTVNLAGLLWVVATVVTVHSVPMPQSLHLPIMLWYAALAWRSSHDVTQKVSERRSCERTTRRMIEE